MNKIYFFGFLAFFMVLFSAPTFVSARTEGTAYYNGSLVDVVCDANNPSYFLINYNGYISANGTDSALAIYYFDSTAGYFKPVLAMYTTSIYLSGISSSITQATPTNSYYGSPVPIYSDYDDFEDNLPPSLQRSKKEKIWDAIFDFYDFIGFPISPGDVAWVLREYSLGDHSQTTEIIFPTLTPTPTPTPVPTPIPVQIIYVPDGNGNTTVVYQYTDPTTNQITQSPTDPNIDFQYSINCDCSCSGTSDNDLFTTPATDPYSISSAMTWADGFGVEMSDNPLTAANVSQQSLAAAASEYSSSVDVVSNSFNVLPIKWITLVGMLGGILIIAGLMRTFLGG